VSAAIPLLESKLHVPRRRRGLVPRARLDQRLDRYALPAVALVSAPAGFGKTTLLVDWLGGETPGSARTAWLSLDRRDSDPSVFWSYIVAALRKVAPAIGTDALAMLQTSPSALQAVVAMLLNDLAALSDDLVLVLDDYHAVESIEVQESMLFLVENIPAQLHLVVASRADPPWPLAGLRARGDLVEIRTADLRFTGDEASAYLNDAMGLDLAPRQIDALEGRTEGWIAALQLAALSLQGRSDPSEFIEGFAGDDRFVVDYLVDEVLSRQPDDIRTFLLETSILSRLSAPLCAAVTDRRDAKAILEVLERSNLFIVPLDDGRRWYRYHHLFADVLRARLADEQAQLVAELHLRASIWHEQNGDTADAVHHAMAGRHFERAAQLVELAGPQLRRTRQERTLRLWLEALPADVYEDRPVLAIALVGARMATGTTHGVEELLQLVESTIERASPPPTVFDEESFAALPVQLAVQRAGLALLSADVANTIAHATRALELVEPDDHLRRGSAVALLALAQWTAGDLAAAERRYAEAIQALIAAGHLADMLGCSLALADIQIAQGRLTDATRTFEAGLRWTTDHPGLRGAADMHVGLSEVLIERNDLEGAARHLATSVDLGESAGLPQYAYRWRVTMARLCRARGDLDRALELIDEAAPLFDTDFSPPVRPVAALRTRVQLAREDTEAAQRWATERGLGADDDLSYIREFEHITYSRVLIARYARERDVRLLDEALTLLARLRAAADEGGRVGSLIEILVQQATAHHAHRDVPAAIAALDQALTLAERDGHVRLFLHAGPSLITLLQSAASSAAASPHVRLVLAAAQPTGRPPAPRAPSTLVDELSARELDVLRLLRSDLSGPDIARELIVSINTVRTHTKNIFMKLGATNRREAVRRADELGL
jgi:LuxR family maltose regulon positive regulatory protein